MTAAVAAASVAAASAASAAESVAAASVAAAAAAAIKMAFFKRLMDHMLNQVLVETLANSRWFQRFAVYTHRLTKEAAEKSEHG